MAQQQHAQAIQQLKSPEERDKEMLDAAPKAFNNALSIIDREIDKQQEKNDSLKKQNQSGYRKPGCEAGA